MTKKEETEFEFEIVKHVCTLSEGKWNLEMNIVKFGDNEPKMDIRKWNDDHTKMSKGIQLTEDEYMTLVRFIKGKKR